MRIDLAVGVRRVLMAAGLTVVMASGCSNRPATIGQPEISASRAGSLAMEEYDQDGDGLVGGAELESAPGLRAALATLDTDSDGKVSADEVTARVNAWKEFRTGVTTVRYRVVLDGSPLTNADVTFEPESFLGDSIQTAVGKTNDQGMGKASVPKANRPTPATPPGLALGLYKVRISKMVGGQETIPARYNEQTILGQQISPDDPSILSMSTTFVLESN